MRVGNELTKMVSTIGYSTKLSAFILLSFGILKAIQTVNQGYSAVIDPIIRLPIGLINVLVVPLELSLGGMLLINVGGRITNIIHVFLGLSFTGYHFVAALLGLDGECPCLLTRGTLPDFMHFYQPQVAYTAAVVILMEGILNANYIYSID